MTNHEQLDHEQLDTQLVNLGRDPKRDLGSVNPPVHRTSTVIFPDFAAFDAYEEGKSDHRGYGRYGTPTSDALEEALVTLEGADHA
ncbi:MAG: PLP-dependent transferase, partial [Alphaproteobacteria bacterium]